MYNTRDDYIEAPYIKDYVFLRLYILWDDVLHELERRYLCLMCQYMCFNYNYGQ